MRIGLVADIHGNAFALRAVLAELDRLGVDNVCCLGDVATPGPWPVEVISLLMERRIPCVLGNTDEWLLANDPARVSDIPMMNVINAWASAQLDADARSWLASLPMHRTIDVEGTLLALFHGSPRSTTEVISATTPRRPLREMLNGVESGIAAGGHTHVQMLRNSGSLTIINPGSVGLGGTGPGTSDLPPPRPVDDAGFAVVDIVEGAMAVAFHRLPLDVPAMIAAAGATGMPELGWWRSLWTT